MQLSKRLDLIQPSATAAVTQKAADLRASGRDVISLGLGEPDFDTPDYICDAAYAAMKAGKTHYTAPDGALELKQAIVEKFSRENDLSFSTAEISVGSGAKQSIYNLLQVLLDAGDEVIIPAPCWVSYPDMVKLAGGHPVVVSADMSQQFKITAEQLNDAINEKTKLLILNSPCNPTGMEYTAEDYQAFADILLQHPRVTVMVDDIYEHLRWSDQPFVTMLNVCPELKDRTFTLNGVSKAYAMTGWRIGYMAGPEVVINAMRKIQSQSTSNPSSISQFAAIAALNGGLDEVKRMVSDYAARSKMVYDALEKIPGVSCLPTYASLYLFLNIKEAMQQKSCATDVEFAEQFLQDTGVALVPGTAFYAPGFLRLSIAAKSSDLMEAVRRLAAWLVE